MKKIQKHKIAIALLSMAVVLGACSNAAATESGETATTAETVSYDSGAAAVDPASLSMADLVTFDDDDTAAEWSADGSVSIELSGTSAAISGSGAAAADGSVTITEAGTYVLSGTLNDGQIVVDAGEEDIVRLVLNGVSLTDQDNAPIYVKGADKTVITLADGTENTVTDGTEYTLEDGEDEPNAAIFSKDDLTINGTGSLTVKANYNDGIASNDDLKIVSGKIQVQSADDGMVGRDLLAVQDGEITIDAGGDGMKATNDEEADKGVIAIAAGTFDVVAENDAIQAETTLLVDGGDYNLVTGGGSANAEPHAESGFMGKGGMGGGRPMPGGQTDASGTEAGAADAASGTAPAVPAEPPATPAADDDTADASAAADAAATTSTADGSASAKGLKAGGAIAVNDGTFTIDSADDAVNGNANVTISGGKLTIASGEDAVHADATLTIAAGTIDITASYEGLEGAEIAMAGGDVHVTASDDGVNASGSDTTMTNEAQDTAEAAEDAAVDATADATEDATEDTAADGAAGQRPGGFGGASNGKLTISGGYLYVDADGDGLDVNGSASMSGGTVIVNGPTNSGNGSLDYDGTFEVSGGVLISAGSSGMAQAPSTDSGQSSIAMTYPETQATGTIVRLEDASGNAIATFAPSKDYSMIVISSPELKQGESYTLYSGGTSTGTAKDGLYTDGEYSGGTKVVGFELSSATTWLNESGVTEAQTGRGFGGGGRRQP
ncbi:carbohydrate-binding domain-containing protein [Paenibacillus thailandensis]|uniref:Carbohydrate-binding domain-containing protein n=1 Tax=Paenibacillus thailandensis TaxID=393250 RepID=A0ABW5R4D8_9BACL